MLKILASIILLPLVAFAGLPPTTVKVPGDSAGVTSFNTVFVGFTGSHSGTTTTITASPAAKASGEVFMTAATSCPTGSIAADGSSLLRSGGTSCGGSPCANLFTAISTTYGTVDGTHFTLPNMKAVFPRGAGTQVIGGITYTGTQGTTQGDQLQGHQHNETMANGSGFAAYSQAGGGTQHSIADQGAGNLAAGLIATVNYVSDGTNGTPRTGTETQPANITLLYCIAY